MSSSIVPTENIDEDKKQQIIENNAEPIKEKVPAKIEPIAVRKKPKKEKKEEIKELTAEEIDRLAREEKRKLRTLVKLTIHSIYITDIPNAHPFAKNNLWLKCMVGDKKFLADYIESDVGDRAEYHELEWEFIRPRNIVDRVDLVVLVGSNDVIIGRYLLAADELEDIPKTKSGFFEIEGTIYSGIGAVGNIKLVCKRSEAERPSRAVAPNIEDILVYPTTKLLPLNAKAYVKLISIAVIDMKAMHILEPNCPHSIVTCGKYWIKKTSVIVHAGKSAQWDRLPWRLVIHNTDTLEVTVETLGKVIGKICVSLGEMAAIAPDENGFTQIVRHILDGANLTGRIRLVLLLSTTPQHADDEEGELHYDNIDEQIADDETLQAVLQAQNNLDDERDTYNTNKKEYIDPNKPVIHYPYNLSVPFKLFIIALTVTDTKAMHMFQPNSLYVNAACGSYGGCTSTIKKSGPSAHWMGLKWHFIINDNSLLRITAWSKNNAIGSVNLSPKELLNKPCDFKGVCEIFLQIADGHTTGKLKLCCKYEPYVDTNKLKLIRSSEYLPPELINLPVPELPIMLTVKEITVFDLKKVHKVYFNSPRVKLMCDRKCAYTKSKKWAGEIAVWSGLCWPVPLNSGSEMVFSVYSRDKVIGTFEVSPSTLAAIHKKKGVYEYASSISRNGYQTGKMRFVFDIEPISAETYKKNYPLGGRRTLLPGSEAVPQFDQFEYTLPIFDHVAIMSPESRAARGYAVTVSIIEVDAIDLANAHMFRTNSPQVHAFCGKWETSSKVLYKAGSVGFWDVDWIFKLKDDMNLRFNVDSREVLIGTGVITPSTLIEAQSDPRGVKRITTNLYSDDKKTNLVGKIKISYLVDASFEQTKSEAFLAKNIQQQDNAGGEDEEDNIPLSYPMILTINNIIASDLQQIQRVGRLNPYIVLSCGHSTFQTKKCKKIIDDRAKWDDVSLEIVVPNENSVVQIDAKSGSNSIGFFTLTGAELMDWPRKNNGLLEIQRSIYDNDDPTAANTATTGRLQILAKIRGQGMPKFVIDFNKKIKLSDAPDTPRDEMEEIDDFDNIDEELDTELLPDIKTPIKEKQNLNYVKKEFPINITILSVAIVDMRSAHRISPNSPFINVECGEWKTTSEIQVLGGKAADWVKLNWLFRLEKDFEFKIECKSQSSLIGIVSISAVTLLESGKSDKNGKLKMIVSLKHEGTEAGKVKITYKLDNVPIEVKSPTTAFN